MGRNWRIAVGVVGCASVLFGIVIGAASVTRAASASADEVGAANTAEWVEGPLDVVAKLPNQPGRFDTVPNCNGGEINSVYMKFDNRYYEACVFGSVGSMRFAHYTTSSGQRVYAVAFALDTNFYRIHGICESDYQCAYSPENDILVVAYYRAYLQKGIGVYERVSRSFVRKQSADLSEVYYEFVPAAQPREVQINGQTASTGSFTLAGNGQWLAVELPAYGMGIVDTKTLSGRRIQAPGQTDGPPMELAVSNDGRHVAVMGYQRSVVVYEVDDQCGDSLATLTQGVFAPSVRPCSSVYLDSYKYFSDFDSAHYPFFNTNSQLSLVVLSKSQGYVSTVIKPHALQTSIQSVPYLALGDSYSSGEGETSDTHYLAATNISPHICHVSDRSYPFILAQHWGITGRSVACSGAQTTDVTGSAQYRGQGGRVASLDEAHLYEERERALELFRPGVIAQRDFVAAYAPQQITLGMGGNDAGFMDKLKVCVGFDTCEWADSVQQRYATAREIADTYDKLVEVVRRLKNASPESAIVLVGYPEIVSENTSCNGLVGLLLNQTERVFINESIRFLNKVISTVAKAENVQYADVEHAFVGHRLCEADESAMNGVRLGDDMPLTSYVPGFKIFASESFHPTPKGHELLAEAIFNSQKFAQSTALGYSSVLTVAKPIPAGLYWQGSENAQDVPLGGSQGGQGTTGASRRQVVLPGPAESFTLGAIYSVSAPVGIFEANSVVDVSLHSNHVSLGSFTATNNGAFTASVALPSDVATGYHTIHLFGTNPAGELVDVYRVVFIGASVPQASVASGKPVPVTESSSQAGPSLVPSAAPTIATAPTTSALPMTTILGSVQKNGTGGGVLDAQVLASRRYWEVIVAVGLFLAAAVVYSLKYKRLLTKRYNNSMNVRSAAKSIIPTGLFQKIEPFGHLVEAVLANVRYGFPARKVRIIGVTGTNGKTTTSFFIHRMLHEAGVKVALSTTVGYGIGAEITMQQEHITTAQAGVLQKRLRNFAKAGVEWVVLETSSHSLAQHRVWGVPYEIAVMTNVTHDHLDYHKTFERYRDAKRRLFKIANRHGMRFGVVNADDQSWKLFASDIANYTTYGIHDGDLCVETSDLTNAGSRYVARVGNEQYNITLQLPGEFNVSNSLAALAVGRKLGLGKKDIEKGIGALEFVEGRMNRIRVGQKFQVIVDFASTPDGFEKLFASLRPLVKGKLVVVFGSAGRRDSEKRSTQGEIAGKYADYVIATEEDDRDEDGQLILEQIAQGAEKSGKVRGSTLYLIQNREEAIGYAMTLVSDEADTVLLLGKGHEKTIERADGVYPWNETEAAQSAIEASLRYEHSTAKTKQV